MDARQQLDLIEAHFGLGNDRGLAERIGVPHATVNKWAIRRISPNGCRLIAAKLGVSIDWLMTRRGDMLASGAPALSFAQPKSASSPGSEQKHTPALKPYSDASRFGYTTSDGAGSGDSSGSPGTRPEDAGRQIGGMPFVALGVVVVGSVQAGAWREAMEWEYADRFIAPLPLQDPRYPGIPLFGLRVDGNSVNKKYPNGTIVGCIDLIQNPVNVEPGRYVVVQRMNKEGLVEATIKQLEIGEDGGWWLWPRSTDPEHQAPIKLPKNSTWDTETGTANDVRIIALVVGGWTRD